MINEMKAKALRKDVERKIEEKNKIIAAALKAREDEERRRDPTSLARQAQRVGRNKKTRKRVNGAAIQIWRVPHSSLSNGVSRASRL